MTSFAPLPAPPAVRRHAFEGIHNFRDLGGYPTRSGHPTRYGVVFRSACPAQATAADRQRLGELGIGMMFDLRSFRELIHEGAPDFSEIGIVQEHVPVFADQDASPEQLIARYKACAQDIPDAYFSMMTAGAAAYRRVVESAATAVHPIAYHCAAGKDRTGVLSALFLALAGVEEAHIVADYALTSHYLPPPTPERLQELRKRFGMSRSEVLALYSAQPAAMRETLRRVQAVFGSAEGYLRTIGVSDHTLGRVRERLIGPH